MAKKGVNSAENHKKLYQKSKQIKKYLKKLLIYIAKCRQIVYNGESDNSQNIQYQQNFKVGGTL